MKFNSLLLGSAVLAAGVFAAPRPSMGRDEFARRHQQGLAERKAAIRERSNWGSKLGNGHQSHAAFIPDTSSHVAATEATSTTDDDEVFTAGTEQQNGVPYGSYATIYTSNWAGAVQQVPPSGEEFNYVAATWVIPTVTRPSGETDSAWYVAEWIGIDGYSYQDAILQAGILTEVTYDDNNEVNSTTVSAWYEWYPSPLQYFEFDDFETGDEVTISVEAKTSTSGLVIVQNLSKGMQVSIGVNAPSDSAALGGQNAEWIVEDISEGELVNFGQFTEVNFYNAIANTSSSAVGLSGATIINMQQDSAILATGVLNGTYSLDVTYGSS